MKNKIYIIILIAAIISLILFAYLKSSDYVNTEISVKSEEQETVLKEEPPLQVQTGLPEKVEERRQAIYRAALSRDYEKLANEATYENFAYTYGGPYPGGFAGFLKLSSETEGKSAFDIIPILLRLPYSYSGQIYTWPYLASKNPEEWTTEDIGTLREFLSDEQIESFRQFGGYVYYRLGIDSDGKWIYYIAGD